MAVLSVLGFLLVIAIVLTAPQGVEIEWGLYLIIAFSVVQAIVAVAALLFDAGVITPPAPKPRYEQQQQYGQYGGPGPYYGQPHQPGPQHQPGQQQRPGYPSPVRRWLPGRSVDGGFPGGQHSGPPTPPTGFPDLRPAAVEQCGQFGQFGQREQFEQCSHDTGARTGVVFHTVRPAAVVVWAARASTSRA